LSLISVLSGASLPGHISCFLQRLITLCHAAGQELLLQAESPIPKAQSRQGLGRPHPEGDVSGHEQDVVCGKLASIAMLALLQLT